MQRFDPDKLIETSLQKFDKIWAVSFETRLSDFLAGKADSNFIYRLEYEFDKQHGKGRKIIEKYINDKKAKEESELNANEKNFLAFYYKETEKIPEAEAILQTVIADKENYTASLTAGYWLGCLYLDTKKKDLGIQVLRSAAEKGGLRAMVKLGDKFQAAMEAGDLEAPLLLAEQYMENDPEKELSCLCDAISKGNLPAIASLAAMFDNGAQIIKQNKRKALDLYDRAAQCGLSHALAVMCEILISSKKSSEYDCKPDPEKAAFYLRKAAECEDRDEQWGKQAYTWVRAEFEIVEQKSEYNKFRGKFVCRPIQSPGCYYNEPAIIYQLTIAMVLLNQREQYGGTLLIKFRELALDYPDVFDKFVTQEEDLQWVLQALQLANIAEKVVGRWEDQEKLIQTALLGSTDLSNDAIQLVRQYDPLFFVRELRKQDQSKKHQATDLKGAGADKKFNPKKF